MVKIIVMCKALCFKFSLHQFVIKFYFKLELLFYNIIKLDINILFYLEFCNIFLYRRLTVFQVADNKKK